MPRYKGLLHTMQIPGDNNIFKGNLNRLLHISQLKSNLFLVT